MTIFLAVRNCSLCHAPDRPELNEDAPCKCEGGDVLGHTTDCPRIEHYIQKDIQLQETPLTKKQQDRGWQDRPQGFRGRKAIERLICVPCRAKQEQIDELVAFRRKKVQEMDPNHVPTMYQILSQ
jgi:hypothetical protein